MLLIRLKRYINVNNIPIILSIEELLNLSYILSSKRRYKIIIALYNKIYTPSALSEKTNLKIHDLSKILSELRDKGIVECINPNAKKGRLYRLTKTGEKIIELLDQNK